MLGEQMFDRVTCQRTNPQLDQTSQIARPWSEFCAGRLTCSFWKSNWKSLMIASSSSYASLISSYLFYPMLSPPQTLLL